MKNDIARKDNQVKVETVKSNNAKAGFQFNMIKQKVRLSNEKDSFWIDATAMLPAIQNLESARAEGSAVKPSENSIEYLNWLVEQLVASEGIENACKLVLNKCYMIKFNHEIGTILKASYQKLLAENPNMPVNKFDVEKLINDHVDVAYFNENHKWPATEKADKVWNACLKIVKQLAERDNWSDDQERIQRATQKLYSLEVEKAKKQQDLLASL